MTTSVSPDVQPESLSTKTVRGVLWMMLLKLAVRGLGLISTLILVRLLSPQDFGLVAMAMVFIAVMEVFSWFSFDVMLIQKQNAMDEDYDTAWTFQLLFQTLSGLILAALAWPAAVYYGEPRVLPIILIFAAGVALSGYENIGIVNFRKNMTFDKDFRFMLSRKLAGFCVTVPLALMFRNYWALIAGMVASRVAGVVLSYAMEPYRPRLCLKSRHELFNFSRWLFVSNVLYAVRSRGVDLIIGRMSGARSLGLFTVSYEISNLPTTELVAPINRAVFPGYAKISSSLEALREGYLSVIGLIALFAVPGGIGIAATADLIVPLALGDQWLDATPLIAILGFYGIVNALQTNIASACVALGRPQVLSVLSAVHLVVLVVAVILATSEYGVLGAAWAYLGTALALLPLNYSVMFRTIELQRAIFVARIWRPLVAAAVMYAGVKPLSVHLAAGVPHLLHFGLAVAAGVAIYVLAATLLWLLCGRPEGAESYILEEARVRWRTRTRFRFS